jgi:uncharacterized protein involved in response to NO
MVSSAQQIRGYRGPALFSYGFRPFFLLGGLWAPIAMILWIAALTGGFALPSSFSMLDWHVHELLFGYVPAVMAGFLLTAIPNWTGRLPVVGLPLMSLTAIWFAGRAAMLVSALIGTPAAAAIDLAFLASLAAVTGREIMAGRNWRNLRVLVLVILLLLANGAYHWEAHALGLAATGHSARAGIAIVLLLIMLVGGRIVPSFTHNWLARRGPGRLPVAFNRFDVAVMAVSAVALGLWVRWPDTRPTAPALALAALLNAWRLWRWAGPRTLAEPLVWVLHLAYAFIPLGFALAATLIVMPGLAAAGAAIHAWTSGAIGLMTLAVMTRASLGHTGQPLHATPAIAAIYVLVAAAALARIAGSFTGVPPSFIHAAGGLWIAGYALFVVRYAPLLLRPR